jgi:hypothetical protein
VAAAAAARPAAGVTAREAQQAQHAMFDCVPLQMQHDIGVACMHRAVLAAVVGCIDWWVSACTCRVVVLMMSNVHGVYMARHMV